MFFEIDLNPFSSEFWSNSAPHRVTFTFPHYKLVKTISKNYQRLPFPFVTLVAIALFPFKIFAQSETRTVTVTQVADRITVDGVLDEAIWKEAPKIGELVQRQPDTGQAPTERTEATLLYDANNLYIGVVAYDSEPDKVIGTVMERDGSLNSDDREAPSGRPAQPWC